MLALSHMNSFFHMNLIADLSHFVSIIRVSLTVHEELNSQKICEI